MLKLNTPLANIDNYDIEPNEIKKLKRFILFELAYLQSIIYKNPNEVGKTLNAIKKDIANYDPNHSCVFPSNKTIEGRIQQTLIKEKLRKKLNIKEN